MKANRRSTLRAVLVIALMFIITIASSRLRAETGTCGGASITLPFTDVPSGNIFFCSIAEAFFSGLTNGTSAATYSPSDPVPREQMAAFVTRAMDQSLKRGSRRASLKQFWTPTSADGLGLTTIGTNPQLVESDGADLWVANLTGNTVSRVRGSDGKLLETWTGATSALGVVVARGLVFVTGNTNPGNLYQIDPTQPVGAVTTLPISLGAFTNGISFDGARIWTANNGTIAGSVSIVTLNPLSVTNVTAGITFPTGILYDGASIWVTDDQMSETSPGKLFKLDSSGAIIQSVTVGRDPQFPVFDGTNIWVPNYGSNTASVVRVSTGEVLATLSGNGLNGPRTAAFDGERVLFTNESGQSVSLWRATDLTALGSVSTGASTFPKGVCSDGLNFWIALNGAGKLARF